jgi:hypothetical protein
MTDVDAWRALAKLHHLNAIEVDALKSCLPTLVAEQRQLDDAAHSIRTAHGERNHERLSKLLCVLLRADLAPVLSCGALAVATLCVGLEREEVVTPGMAVAVRLARVLACKLERVYAFSKSFEV